jgi:flagellar biosynthesis protein FlhB
VTGIVDLLWSIKKRNQRLMMDYNEMIQDLKENEGNQEMKAMRRRAHQEILREADINRVRAAKVLLTD